MFELRGKSSNRMEMLRDDLYRDMGESKLYQGGRICIDFGLIYWGA